MSTLFFVVAVTLFGVLAAQLEVAMPKAIKSALRSSFNGPARVVSVAIQTTHDDMDFLDTLGDVLAEKWDFAVQLDVNHKDRRPPEGFNLLFVDSYEAFRELLSLIRQQGGDQPIFALIVLKPEGSSDLIQRIFTDLFTAAVVNVCILVERSPGEVLFYSYFPYQGPVCQSTAPVLVHRFTNGSPTRSSLFPPKANDLHGCPVRLIVRSSNVLLNVILFKKHLPRMGLEGELLYELADRMNFTPVVAGVRRWNWDLVLAEGKPTGPFRMLTEGQVDLMAGFFLHEPTEDRLFTPSTTYFHSSIVIALQRPPRKIKFKWLTSPLDLETWICTIVLFILSAVCATFASRNRRVARFLLIQPHHSQPLNVLAMALGMPTPHVPTTSILRWCFVIWSLSVMIIRATYQGKLFVAYRRVSDRPAPITVTQLLDDQYTIYSRLIYSPIINELSGNKQVHYRELIDLQVIAPNGPRSRPSAKNAVIGSQAFILSYFSAQQLENIITQRLRGQLVCMFFQKHSVLAERVNLILERMDAAGVLHQWKVKYKFIKQLNVKPIRRSSPRPVPFFLVRYLMEFLVGPLYALAVAVFIGEVVVYRWQRAAFEGVF